MATFKVVHIDVVLDEVVFGRRIIVHVVVPNSELLHLVFELAISFLLFMLLCIPCSVASQLIIEVIVVRCNVPDVH